MYRWLALIPVAAFVASAQARELRELRVCADPNNMPFSNDRRQGFENRVVDIVARELDAEVIYVWWAQRRGNIRETLQAGRCDVIPGIAAGLEMLATTQPYYRSTYVFVTRNDRRLDLAGLDDQRLRRLTIGVQMIGDDFSNTPPAHALARRGIVQNIRGYMVYGDYARDSPPRLIVDDVANGTLDVAVVWGPLAGYFAAREPVPLHLQPVTPANDGMLPMQFAVAMGVRKQDRALLAELDRVLARKHEAITDVLRTYDLPLQ
jgi:mxaJ protein